MKPIDNKHKESFLCEPIDKSENEFIITLRVKTLSTNTAHAIGKSMSSNPQITTLYLSTKFEDDIFRFVLLC